jgi:hypothetical protein
MNKPDPFIDVRVHRIDLAPSYSGLCVGYERGKWRDRQLADHVLEWLPEFALSSSECEKMGHSNAVAFIRRAAKVVYDSEKFRNRGEFGELFLHIAMRQMFNSLPAISKIYYKTSNNETVKGFDAVHVVGPPTDLELWIGEAKFYNDISRAIRDVMAEISDHTQTDYLRSEFTLIANKIDDAWQHAAELKKLLDPKTSLDQVFKRACIPVLLTYDSPVIANHAVCDDSYVRSFCHEVSTHYKSFAGKALPSELRLHLFLFPLKSKTELIALLDEKLKTWQKI